MPTKKPRYHGTGRPRTIDGPTLRTTVNLSADQHAWLLRQPGGASATIRRLVERAMTRDKGGG